MFLARKLLLFIFWLGSFPVLASEQMPILKSSQHDGRFVLSIEAHSDMPIDTLWRLLNDYPNLHYYHPAITESKTIQNLKHGVRVKTRLEDCFLFYCQAFNRVEDIKQAGPYRLISHTLPEQSDFKYGLQEWQLKPDGKGTSLFMKVEIEPKETPVPWIGSSIIEYSMKQSTLEFLENLEKISNQPQTTNR